MTTARDLCFVVRAAAQFQPGVPAAVARKQKILRSKKYNIRTKEDNATRKSMITLSPLKKKSNSLAVQRGAWG
jgi:hypothetical protein